MQLFFRQKDDFNTRDPIQGGKEILGDYLISVESGMVHKYSMLRNALWGVSGT